MMRGFTLFELAVTLLLLGLLVGVSGLAIRLPDAAREDVEPRDLLAARAQAIETGRPTAWTGDSLAVRFLPNGASSGGRVTLGGSTWIIDPLPGAIHAAR